MCQLLWGLMPHPNFPTHSIILGCPALSRQQMPRFGDVRCIASARQTWLQDRFPCHVGLLAELCSNPEAYRLQQTLTIVWGHLPFTSEFRASSWPPHTFSRGFSHTKAERPGACLHPGDEYRCGRLILTVCCVRKGTGSYEPLILAP